MLKAEVRNNNILAGYIIKDDESYKFYYDKSYLMKDSPDPISLTLPLSDAIYESNILFPFFDGLIPEGWLLDIAEKHWKINQKDRMKLLLTCCQDCIGSVSVHEVKSNE